MNRVLRLIAPLLFLAWATACGYHLKGGGLTAPAGLRTIAFAVLENRTSESGIENVFTSHMIDEFTRSKVLRVVDRDAADAVLDGTIASMNVETVSHTASFMSNERRVTVTLDLSLKRRDGEIVWSDRALTDSEAFDVNPSNKRGTDSNRREAIEKLSERMAEKIHNRILQDF